MTPTAAAEAKQKSVDEVVAKTKELQYVPVGLVIPSKHNPRRRRNPEKDAELLESVRKDGVIQAIVVRPLTASVQTILDLEQKYKAIGVDQRAKFGPGEAVYEIVAGERRWEACVKSNRVDIPAAVRRLSDEQARYLQIVENLQREDISPLDEGRAFRALLQQGKTAQEIAETIGKGKSPRYVYARAKLCDLIPGVMDWMDAGKISAGHGDLLSRLQAEGQKNAMRWLESMEKHTSAIPGVRDLDGWIKTHVHIALDTGPWKKADATLVPTAGACSACPKNSAVNAEAFPEAKRATCIDPACFNMKLKAWHERQDKEIKEGNKSGSPAKPAPAPSSGANQPARVKTVPQLGPKKLEALHRALLHVHDADKRWAELVRKGATDAQLKARLGDEHIRAAAASQAVEYQGGANPRIWFSMDRRKKPDLHGAGLIAAVRDLLQIPTPEQAKAAAKEKIERARAQKAEEKARRLRTIEDRVNGATFLALSNKAALDAWTLKKLGPTIMFEAWDAGLHLDAFAQEVLKWPKPKQGSTYTYNEVRKYVDRVKFSARSYSLVIALMLWSYNPPQKFAELASHFVNTKAIKRQVLAQMKAETRKGKR